MTIFVCAIDEKDAISVAERYIGDIRLEKLDEWGFKEAKKWLKVLMDDDGGFEAYPLQPTIYKIVIETVDVETGEPFSNPAKPFYPPEKKHAD